MENKNTTIEPVIKKKSFWSFFIYINLLLFLVTCFIEAAIYFQPEYFGETETQCLEREQKVWAECIKNLQLNDNKYNLCDRPLGDKQCAMIVPDMLFNIIPTFLLGLLLFINVLLFLYKFFLKYKNSENSSTR
jgi:hypothetical protein